MRAVVFPGQGAQFEGMGKELYDSNPSTRAHFDKADEILGFNLTEVMFNGTIEELKQTKITQPAIYLYSLARFFSGTTIQADDVVAGHSLGEISALVASSVLSFEDGLLLVKERAMAMQEACELSEGTMAAILGLENNIIEEVCAEIDDVVVPANYNCPGQLVISGSITGIDKAIAALTEKGARRALKLRVGGAFHSPLMDHAQDRLSAIIKEITFNTPSIAIVQNVDAKATTDPEIIKENLNKQLTSPVRWSQTMETFKAMGVTKQVEAGASVLSGFIRKFDRSIETEIIN